MHRGLRAQGSGRAGCGIVRIPVKPSTCSGDVVHLSERSDASTGILPQVVGMGNGESVLRRDSPSRLSR